MTLQDLVDRLVYGELSQLAISGMDTPFGGIEEKDLPKLIVAINRGLTALHSIFPLKLKELIIQQEEQISLYKIDIKYCESNKESDEPIKYIKDSEYDPYLEDLLCIERVVSEFGDEYPLNDPDTYWSVHTPSYNELLIPFNEKENQVSVIYRAKHANILVTTMLNKLSTVLIDIPPAIEDALLYYVANVFHVPLIPLAEGTVPLYVALYDKALATIVQNGLFPQEQVSNKHIQENGWC